MEMTQVMLESIQKSIAQAKKGPFYQKRFAGIEPEDVKTRQDFEKLPFTGKEDLREAYPMGLLATPEADIVRIHSSSGTTGTPVIIPYTKKDVDDWARMFKRCYETADITKEDRIHITPGYGLWTAGIGFQLGAEMLGAMAIPMGPGNTDKQIQVMMDLGSTVLGATSSYALLLAEEITRRGVKDRIKLKKGVIGSERWGEKMRNRIAAELGIELYDIYGLTEIYGPGIGISCRYNTGMHMWSDYLYFEIIDPETGEQKEPGEVGEIVITTLQKEGAPLIRYRTHDLTREIPGRCPCGRHQHPRIDTIFGRSDDMIKVKGAILYPSNIDQLLATIDGASSEYQFVIETMGGRDTMTLTFETQLPPDKRGELEHTVMVQFKKAMSASPIVKAVGMGELPRSEKKTTRVFDRRD